MDYFERCSYLNFNPVLLARQFQYRVEFFFQTLALNGSLGRVKYYAIREKCQHCGSPHIPSFLWILNNPVLTKDDIKEYITFSDGIIRANVLPLPDRMTDDEKKIQKHDATLSTVKDYIKQNLDPKKTNILNQIKADYKQIPLIIDTLCQLGTTKNDTLSLSSDDCR